MENKLISFKKMTDGKYFFDGNIYFLSLVFFFIILFPFIYLGTRNLGLSIAVLFIFWIIINVIVLISDYFGKKMHSKIFEKKVFKNLIKKGFQKENIYKYEGLTKEINGRTIRVFYNWNKVAEGALSFGDIEIDIYFEPQLINDNIESIDELKLRNLTKLYDKTFWSKTNRTIFAFDRLKLFFNYYPWTNSTEIEEKIDFGLKILEENNLKPFSIKSINKPEHKILEERLYFLPNMEYIWKHLEENFR